MAENDRHFDPLVRITGNSDKCRQKTVAELPTQVVNDKGDVIIRYRPVGKST